LVIKVFTFGSFHRQRSPRPLQQQAWTILSTPIVRSASENEKIPPWIMKKSDIESVVNYAPKPL
jgi:hypothetical protein